MSVDVKHFRKRLDEERVRVVEALDNLQRENPGTADDDSGNLASSSLDQHPADGGTETHDRELDEGLVENEEHVLRQIDDALARMEAGEYGKCVRCGKEIPAERLEAVPWAALCIEDQRREER